MKKILFLYKDSKFKNYIKQNDLDVFSKSFFLKGNLEDNKKEIKFDSIEILSIFIDITLEKDNLKLFPNLKKIITRSTGTDHIDKKYCVNNNIDILNVPEYGSKTVAEYALGMLLYLLRNFEHEKKAEKNRGLDLNNKIVGIIGAGKIGKEFIKIISGFGVKILISDPNPDKDLAKEYGAKYVDLKTLLNQSDILSIHAPLCSGTRHLLGHREFVQMKDGIILINTARGGILDTKALYKNLKSGKILKAGLDVLENEHDLSLKSINNLSKTKKEIRDLNKKIIKMKNVFYTPHQAYNTKEAVERIWEKTLENIKLEDNILK